MEKHGYSISSGMRRAAQAVLALTLALVLTLASVLALPTYAFADDQASDAATNDPSLILAEAVAGIQADMEVQDPSGIYSADKMLVGESTSDWVAYDIFRMGATQGSEAYLDALREYVTQAYASDRQLDRNRSTEWSRMAIIVKGLGGDPTSFGTDSSGNPIDLVADGTYDWTHTNDLGTQGSNAYIYALVTLHVTGVEVPEDALYPLDTIIDRLLEFQSDDGGFGLTVGTSGVDITAMSLAALAPYMDYRADVADAVDRGVNYLSEVQGADGRYASDGEDSSESSSMVVIALSALGIDARTDARFVKDRGSAYDALQSYRRADGTFSHSDTDDPSKVEYMATEQAMRAMISYCEFQNGADGNVYTADISLGVIGGSGVAGQSPVPWIIGGVLVGVVIVIIAVVASGKRSHGRRAARAADDSEK